MAILEPRSYLTEDPIVFELQTLQLKNLSSTVLQISDGLGTLSYA